VKQGDFERGKRKPKVESLHNNLIHQKIVGRIRVNYGSKISSIHRFYNNVTFPSGAG
jgi:hypothetical protein